MVAGRKGAVLLDYEMRPKVVSRFSASLAIAKDRWQDMTEKVIHCGSVRQSALPLCVQVRAHTADSFLSLPSLRSHDEKDKPCCALLWQDMHVCSELSDCEPAAAAVVSDEPPPSALVWFRWVPFRNRVIPLQEKALHETESIVPSQVQASPRMAGNGCTGHCTQYYRRYDCSCWGDSRC